MLQQLAIIDCNSVLVHIIGVGVIIYCDVDTLTNLLMCKAGIVHHHIRKFVNSPTKGWKVNDNHNHIGNDSHGKKAD
jgi:hypothetical protein